MSRGTLLFFLFFSMQLQAAEYGAITTAQGLVEIFVEPKSTDSANSKVIYEGKTYHSTKARIGLKVFPGQIVRTGNGAKARIIFNNGDQFTIGPASAYIFPLTLAQKDQPTTVPVLYGKIRAQVSPQGPRNNIEFKNPVAVAGVRGTELVFGYNPATAKSDLNVLRGEVSMRIVDQPKAAPITVSTGFKAEITADQVKEAKEEPLVVQVVRSNKQDLKQIIEDTQVKLEEKDLKNLAPEEKKQIAELEEKAKTNTIVDIKKYQPELAKKLEEKSLTEIQQQTVAELIKEAPVGTPPKPTLKDFQNSQDVYDKYFKPAK